MNHCLKKYFQEMNLRIDPTPPFDCAQGNAYGHPSPKERGDPPRHFDALRASPAGTPPSSTSSLTRERGAGITVFVVLLLTLGACTKDEITQKVVNKQVYMQAEYLYDLGNISLYQDGIKKPHVKTLNEFAAIAYSELFGTTIPSQKITELTQAYVSFGDKKMIEDLMIRNFLNLPGVQIPTISDMNADVTLFINNTYKKFYTRLPNEFELWQMKEYINNNSSTVTPELVYYTFMTSDEYRYY